MKKSRQAAPVSEAPPPPRRPQGSAAGLRRWHYFAGLIGAFLIALTIYGPSLNGPFLFDDSYLPFDQPGFDRQPLSRWLAGVRPMSMLTFWINYRLSGTETFSYHLWNVALHAVNALLVFLFTRRLADRAGVGTRTRDWAAGFSAAIFLLHPLQTESVAYIASRTEVLSALFFYGALTLVVYAGVAPISYARSAAVIALFAAAVLSKEHTAVLPAVLLLTDYFWNPGFSFSGARRNWRLYVPVAIGAALGGIFVARVLFQARTAGFGMQDLRWHDYFLTQGRVIWRYLRLFLAPAGLNLDPDVPISRFPDVIAIAGLAALAAVTIWLWRQRRKWPLAAYGWLLFLITLAPTSSIVPIRDVMAERRMYLAMPGLGLIAIEILRRLRIRAPALAAAAAVILVLLSAATWSRSRVYASAIAMWEDSAAKSPAKSRPRFQLAHAYYREGRCAEAVREYERTGDLMKHDYSLLVDWALALDCAGQADQAIAKLEAAAKLENTGHVHAQMGMVYGKSGQNQEALAALDRAEQINPRFEMTYVYRGNVYRGMGLPDKAAAEYRRALAINPRSEPARAALAATPQSGR